MAHVQSRREGRARAFILCGDLARAVQRESNQAVCHWWGVTPQTVSQWRKALDVPRANEGTQRLNRELFPEKMTPEELERARKLASSPQANAKKAAAKLGKPRPPHVIAAMRRATKGRTFSPEHRAKLSAAQRARGAWPPPAGRPWTEEEDSLLGTMRDAELAKRLDRTVQAVGDRRAKGIPPCSGD